MRAKITSSTSKRARWFALVGYVFCLLWVGAAHAAYPLNGAWREVRAGDTPQSVLEDYRNGRLKNFDPALLHRFPQSKNGSWVIITPQPPWDNDARVLTIYPPTMGHVSVWESGQPRAMSLDDFTSEFHGHGRLAWQLPASLAGSAPMLLKFEPSSTLSTPVGFRLQSQSDYQRMDAQWLVFASACFAAMLAMVLMALCFALMLRDVTYALYAGYILCYSLIQGVQTGFLFHPLEWQWFSDMALTGGMAAVAMSVAFASLFMIKFCELRRYAPLLRVPIMAVAVGMVQLMLMRCSHVPLLVEVAQLLLNPLLIIGTLLLLAAAIAAAVRGSRAAWFFLAGWTPLLLLTAMTSAQVGGAMPDLPWLNDASLAGGAFEAIVLSLGLGDRALTLRHDRDIVRVLADHDALTNVLNRRAWSERAAAVLAIQPPRPMTMLFIDLDHFKLLNDHQGHHGGDRALVAVAKALADELRPADLLGRYGGEEFVALLDGTLPDHAMQVATRLCRRIYRLEIPIDGRASLLSASIGVAFRKPGDSLDTLVERADQAMYRAKLNGRNQICPQWGPVGIPEPRLRVVEKRRSDL
jgi:diguanylate cyclase (GGDEF)-like protein